MKKGVLLVRGAILSVLWLFAFFNLAPLTSSEHDIAATGVEVVKENYYGTSDITYENGKLTENTDEDVIPKESDKSTDEETTPEESDESIDGKTASEETTEAYDEETAKKKSYEIADDEIEEKSDDITDGETKDDESEESIDENTELEESDLEEEEEINPEDLEYIDDYVELDELDEAFISGSLKENLSLKSGKADLSLDDNEEEYNINGTTYNKVYATAVDMVKSKSLQKGYLVRVKGYYADGDGGKADYNVSDVKGTVSLKLANGLYANLVFSDEINIRQLGAVGDGKTDDSGCLKQALASGASLIVIPAGTFNLNCKELGIPNGVTIEGEGADKSILCNVNFRAHYGLKLHALACKGAASKEIWNTCEALTARTMFSTTPKGGQSIEFIDCSFSDADYVSWAVGKDGYFENDTVTGCTFTDIGDCAIYHGVNTNNSSYVGNTFLNIGSKSKATGEIAAIWVGDCANVNYTQAKYVEILNNKFENLYTADEYDTSVRHVIMGNFITVRADVAVINGNTIKNLVGFGNDREAIYTKVRDLTVNNNYIENGGSGEGYICNKSQDGNIRTIIKGNTIVGDYGCGIRAYGTAKIFENKITIKHCIAAIYTSQRDGQTGDWPLEIVRNEVNSGAGEAYTINKHTYSDYSSGILIRVIRPMNVCKIMENTLKPTSEYSSYLSVANANNSIYIMKNNINISGFKGHAICVYDKKDNDVVSKQVLNISNNIITADAGLKNVVVDFQTTNTTRKITYSNNTFTVGSSGSKSYALSCSSSTASKDTLTTSGNSSNISNKSMFITTNVKKVTYADDTFAKLLQN